MRERTIVVGDPHTEPGDDLRRFKALSNFLVAQQPDNIVFIGDYLTLDSLSGYDKNKPGKIENRRLNTELSVGKAGIDLVESSVKEYNAIQIVTPSEAVMIIDELSGY